MPAKILRSALRVLLPVAALVFAAWVAVAQPVPGGNQRSKESVEPAKLREHVEMFSSRLAPRDYTHPGNLEKCADYIEQHFREAGAAVTRQTFTVQGQAYHNVIARFGAGKGSKVVVGAHYDSCGSTPGADDNASGVAALLELARLIGRNPQDREVELVAYVLEEPPFFRTESMGSAVHAKSIAGEKLDGVIVLEMVGYFSDEWGSQSYPTPLLHLMYPARGNFIAVVGLWEQGGWVEQVKSGMKGATDLPVYSIRAPRSLPGMDFSDHMNYWPLGINALMVTDTAFYRNKAYHSDGDTADRLDYGRMAKVVVGVFSAITPEGTDRKHGKNF